METVFWATPFIVIAVCVIYGIAQRVKLSNLRKKAQAQQGVFSSVVDAKKWAEEFLGLSNRLCGRAPCRVDFLESVPGSLVAFNCYGGPDGRSCADLTFQMVEGGSWAIAHINLNQTNYTLPRLL